MQKGIRALMLPLRRQFWVMCLIMMVGVLSALAYGGMQPPLYEATAVVQVQPGVDTGLTRARLASPHNLLEMVIRHRLNGTGTEASLGRAAVILRQSIAVRDLTSDAGRTLGLDPEVAGIVVSVLLPDAEMAARIANDLAQQVLDAGNADQLGVQHEALSFYRREEMRLWQESSALQAQLEAAARSGAVDDGDTALIDQRQLTLMQDQYLEVRRRLAAFEIEARLTLATETNQISLLHRASPTEAVSVLRNWMLAGVAGSLMLAVASAIVLDRRYPQNVMGHRVWRVIDDPARPILGVPRFAFLSAVVVCGLIGLATLLR